MCILSAGIHNLRHAKINKLIIKACLFFLNGQEGSKSVRLNVTLCCSLFSFHILPRRYFPDGISRAGWFEKAPNRLRPSEDWLKTCQPVLRSASFDFGVVQITILNKVVWILLTFLPCVYQLWPPIKRSGVERHETVSHLWTRPTHLVTHLAKHSPNSSLIGMFPRMHHPNPSC